MLRRLRRSIPGLLIAALILAMIPCLSGCGTVRSNFGIEHEWGYDFDDGGHRHYKKPKPPKHKKYKKHKKHHHHDDDDDD